MDVTSEFLVMAATLMEIKCSGGIPLWMVKVLSENKIYKTSFSKYGTAYKEIICPRMRLNESVLHRNERKAIPFRTPGLAIQA